MKKKYDVFISYRRTGGFESANLIAEKLKGMGYSVFFDVESLRSGKFNDQLYRVIEQCKDFIVVLPIQGLDRCSNEDGSPNQEDWIRKEVVYAMQTHKNIIPVMLAGVQWPQRMPEGMETLKDYQSITASNHETFDLAMQRLAGYLNSKPHRIKMLRSLVCILAACVALAVVAYLMLLQMARPVCVSIANEYSIAMGLVHELRCEEEEIKNEWDGFIRDYHAASTQRRKEELESELISILNYKVKTGEEIRKQIRPMISLTGWQTFLIGLYGSQIEDAQALPMAVEGYVDDLDSLLAVVKRVVVMRTYKPYEEQHIKFQIQFYEHAVNMMYYTYLQEITKLPEECLKVHRELVRKWNLLPTISLTLQQEEYERLAQVEFSKMESVLQKMESEMTLRENEMYEIDQRLDTLEAMAESLGLQYGSDE